jgi:hypothetical protein
MKTNQDTQRDFQIGTPLEKTLRALSEDSGLRLDTRGIGTACDGRGRLPIIPRISNGTENSARAIIYEVAGNLLDRNINQFSRSEV